jgi:hypothetical protein
MKQKLKNRITLKSEERMHYEAMHALSEYLNQYRPTIDDVLNMIRTLPLGDNCTKCETLHADDNAMRWPGVIYDRNGWLTASYRCHRCHNQWTCGWSDEYLNNVPTAQNA